jgi:hypothetical protein
MWIQAIQVKKEVGPNNRTKTIYEMIPTNYPKVNGKVTRRQRRNGSALGASLNLKEGMRRLALVAGVLGATVGTVGSYQDLTHIIAAHARYRDFKYLAASGTVQNVRKAFYDGHMSLDCSEGDQKPWCKYQEQEYVKVLGPDGKRYLFPAGTTKEKAIDYFKKKGITSGIKCKHITAPGWAATPAYSV